MSSAVNPTVKSTHDVVYVDPFLGAGAVWLALLNPALTPPVSWMGGKRRLAHEILHILGLSPGRPVPCILGDVSWWGWVWPILLDEETGPEVCRWLRSWRGEDPRALWFRLRAAGPPSDSVERAAGLLWLQARAASGVPVWWEGDPGGWWDGRGGLVSMDGHGRGSYAAWQATCKPALVQWASTKIDEAGQTRTSTRPNAGKGFNAAGAGGIIDPGTVADRLDAVRHRLIAGQRPHDAREDRAAGQCGATEPRLLASDGVGVPREAGHKADKSGEDKRTGGMVDPGTIAERLEATRGRLVKASGGEAGFGYDDGVMRGKGWRAFEPGDVASRLDAIRGIPVEITIEHRDALDLVGEWAPRLGSAGRYYLDPPYLGATGYPATCPRERVLAIAETCARHGGRVVLSEAVPLAEDLGPGWEAVQLRRGRKPEWVTTWGCSVESRHGPLFAAVAR